MARQSSTPVQFQRSTRVDRCAGMTSGRGGKMVPLHYVPLLRGDSATGRFTARFDLAEMPKPLQNAVTVNVQAWFVPKSAHPKFSGYDEFMHSYQGEVISTLGASDRTPPDFFDEITSTDYTTFRNSDMATTLGIHTFGSKVNADLIDAYNLVWNFRAASYSSKIARRSYALEDMTEASSIAPAFWGSGKFPALVPDYESALVVGYMDLDVSAGLIPIGGLGVNASEQTEGTTRAHTVQTTGGPSAAGIAAWYSGAETTLFMQENAAGNAPNVWAEMAGSTIGASIANIDKARVTQAMAKLRAAMAGNDATGFENDDVIIAELMQGFRVPDDLLKRPWLLDSQRVTFGMVERHATDAANLDQSVTKGTANVSLSINVPANDVGGFILVVAEVVPDRLYERQGDYALYVTDVDGLPDALRDIQRPEPVDRAYNYRVDARHTAPLSLYGWEPMNNVWQRDFSRLGGIFYQADPAVPYMESRAGIWQPNIVNPAFNTHHYVCPVDFPHDVFADTAADAFEVAYLCGVTIRGLTQIGDALVEANDEFALTAAEAGE